MFNMTPDTTIENMTDETGRNAVRSRDGGLRLADVPSVSNVSNALGGQFGVPIPRSSRSAFWSNRQSRSTTPLGSHVAHVVGVASKEEMVGANAAFVVAPMKHLIIRGNRPVRHLPRHAMGSTVLAVDTDLTVAVVEQAAGPLPTRVGTVMLDDLGPETKCEAGIIGDSHQKFLSGVSRPRWLHPRGGFLLPELYQRFVLNGSNSVRFAL